MQLGERHLRLVETITLFSDDSCRKKQIRSHLFMDAGVSPPAHQLITRVLQTLSEVHAVYTFQ